MLSGKWSYRKVGVVAVTFCNKKKCRGLERGKTTETINTQRQIRGSLAPENCILVLLYVALTKRVPEKLSQSLKSYSKASQNTV